ncbi:MAG: gliding motility-associated C-terminal domain-containing protein [Taibaiella sp.]
MNTTFTKIYPLTCLVPLLLFVAVTFSSQPVKAQRENMWAFNIMEGLDFNHPDTNGYPSPIATSNGNYPWLIPNNYFSTFPRASATICDMSGNLMFYTEGSNIWDKQGTVMPNGKDITGLESTNNSYYNIPNGPVVASLGVTAIVPTIDSFEKYYVFSITATQWLSQWSVGQLANAGKLFYSVVDMGRHGGMGDVDLSQKAILIDSVLADRMVAIRGEDCNIWLLVSNKEETLFKAYEITGEGINLNPVISYVGATGMASTFYPTMWGHLKVSPNRRKLARTQTSTYYIGFEQYCVGGIDVFDFDPATGVVSNRLMLDGNYTTPLIHIKAYGSAEFSSDNSKVYGTLWDDVEMHLSHISNPHLVAQFDLNNPNPPASKLIVDSSSGHDIKRGPDGKIYYGYEVQNPGWMNSLSAITQPNLAGAACVPQRAVLYGLPNAVYQYLPFSQFPNSVPVLLRDTIINKILVRQCYQEKVTISATNTSGKWYKWDQNYPYDEGNTSPSRVVYPGTYVVRYITSNPCSYHIDSFIVPGPKPLPQLMVQECMASVQPVEDTLDWAYIWLKGIDTLHAKPYSKAGDAIYDLTPGSYSLYIQNPDGCDTIFTFEIDEQPFLVVSPSDTIIRYGDSIQLQASGMYYYTWSPSGSLSNDTASNPFARPLHPVAYMVKGISEGGCMDSATIFIDIDYTMPDFVPNAFSPNGDGLNDLFRIENITYQHVLEFRVFNRFGQCVFYTMNAKNGWDGTFHNKPCDIGTYYYLIRIAYPDKREKTLKGDVILIR